MDLRVLAKIVASRVGEKPTDLDALLESLGVEMTWVEKIRLVQSLDGVEAVYHAVSGKIILRKKA
ncbi:MAG: hypothetical protein ABWK05_00115 [Pyrobaculum sp.]